MNTRRWPLLLILLALVFAIQWLREREKLVSQKILRSSPPPQQRHLREQNHARQTPSNQTQRTTEPTKSPLQVQNLYQMTEFLKSSAYQPDLKTTLSRLQMLHTQPMYFQDSNPSTGTLYILRTEAPLKGTRYFHAQYFSDEHQKPFLQHMSFEIPPGKDSLRQAANALKKSFPGLGDPEMQKEGFIMWKWKGGYNVWALRLTKDHLIDDPYNAYSPSDEGTVRVAMELDVPHEDH